MDQGTATFAILQRSGALHHVLVDAEDLERVLAFGHWHYVKGHIRGVPVDGSPRIYLHRFVLRLEPGDPMVDHANGNKLDCRKANLRPSDHAHNGANQAVLTRVARVGRYRGVIWLKDQSRWRAQQKVRGRFCQVGLFDTEEAAHAALVAFREEQGLPAGW